MALVWTAADGEEGAQVWVSASALGSVRMVLLEMVPGTALPDGTIDAQPLLWSPGGEGEWLPGLDIRANSVSSLDDAQLALVGGSNGVNVFANLNGPINLITGGNALSITAEAAALTVSSVCRLFLASDATPVFDVNDDGTRPGTIAFLGKAPTVGRQSVAGDTPQAQLDSIVAGLTAFGLTQDDRPAGPSTQTQIGWAPNAAAQTSNVLTLLPAGHSPGLYLVVPYVFVQTVQASSYVGYAISYSNAGAQTFQVTNAGANSAFNIATLGQVMAMGSASVAKVPLTCPVYSDGISALTVQFTSGGVFGGAALLDLYVAASAVGT